MINSKTKAHALVALPLLFFLVLVFTILVPQAGAQASLACDGLDAVGGFCSEPDTSPTISNVLGFILNILSIIAGVAATIMLIVSGIKYITSQGEPSSIKSARSTLLFAVIGIVIVVFAQTIVFFFVGTSSGGLPPSEVQCVQGSFC